jgi:phage shock protein PspC (stress-responsive transcriptional regulator)
MAPSRTDPQDRDMTETPGTTQSPSGAQPPPPEQPPGPPYGVDREHLRSYEQLRRSTTDRKVAGVAGGLGRHLNVDPTVVRVLLVVLCFFGGAGFLLYGVAWLLVPEDGRTEAVLSTRPGTRNGVLIATAVVAGLLAVANGWGGPGFPWPVLLVGLGVLIYLAVRDKEPTSGAGSTPAATYPAGGQIPTGYDPAYGDQPPVPPWLTAPEPGPIPEPPRRRKVGPRLFGFTLALIAVALGSLGLYDASGAEVLDSAYPALALAVVGLMLVIGSLVGRAGGLILLGVLSALALGVTSIADSVGGWQAADGDRLSVAPTSAAGVRSTYSVEGGRVFVDLSQVRDPANLDGRVVALSAEAGELVVVLPSGIRSKVAADIDGPGQVDLPDDSSGGIDTSLDGTYGAGAGTVTITTNLSVGHIDVRTD